MNSPDSISLAPDPFSSVSLVSQNWLWTRCVAEAGRPWAPILCLNLQIVRFQTWAPHLIFFFPLPLSTLSFVSTRLSFSVKHSVVEVWIWLSPPGLRAVMVIHIRPYKIGLTNICLGLMKRAQGTVSSLSKSLSSLRINKCLIVSEGYSAGWCSCHAL